jgi:hypothetical protein
LWPSAWTHSVSVREGGALPGDETCQETVLALDLLLRSAVARIASCKAGGRSKQSRRRSVVVTRERLVHEHNNCCYGDSALRVACSPGSRLSCVLFGRRCSAFRTGGPCHVHARAVNSRRGLRTSVLGLLRISMSRPACAARAQLPS